MVEIEVCIDNRPDFDRALEYSLDKFEGLYSVEFWGEEVTHRMYIENNHKRKEFHYVFSFDVKIDFSEILEYEYSIEEIRKYYRYTNYAKIPKELEK